MVLLASSYHQSRFLNAADLEREKKFRIKAVTEEAVGEKQEIKLVVWYTNDKRGLVLNKTNNRTIRGAFGDDVAGWKDKIIVIFPTTALLRGKVTPALRVRIPRLNKRQRLPQRQQFHRNSKRERLLQPQRLRRRNKQLHLLRLHPSAS
jgi:hypothetical protein